jgi:hypothetical protein
MFFGRTSSSAQLSKIFSQLNSLSSAKLSKIFPKLSTPTYFFSKFATLVSPHLTILVLIIGGGIGIAVYFGVSAIISGVAPETGGENTDGKNNSSGKSNSTSQEAPPSGSNTTTSASSFSSTVAPTSTTVESTTTEFLTTTEIPFRSIPRRLTSCNGTGDIIDSPWSWAVKIVYQTIAQGIIHIIVINKN